MAANINADTSGGLKLTSDTSGVLELKSAGTTIATVSSTGLAMANGKTIAGDISYPAKAWVNFNGTGTVAIRASGNVSSITDNGTGDYTVNFTTAMADANYSPVVTLYSDKTGAGVFGLIGGINALATGSFQIDTIASASSFAYFDTLLVTVAVFR
tara:strand:+ start:70 stop:537 length:468 start_codon:yes stop_codon:yes gene_type:complete